MAWGREAPPGRCGGERAPGCTRAQSHGTMGQNKSSEPGPSVDGPSTRCPSPGGETNVQVQQSFGEEAKAFVQPGVQGASVADETLTVTPQPGPPDKNEVFAKQ